MNDKIKCLVLLVTLSVAAPELLNDTVCYRKEMSDEYCTSSMCRQPYTVEINVHVVIYTNVHTIFSGMLTEENCSDSDY